MRISDEDVFRFTIPLAKAMFQLAAIQDRSLVDALADTVAYKPMSSISPVLDREETQDRLAHEIETKAPFFMGRFGSTELRAVVKFFGLQNRRPLEKYFAFMARGEMPFWYGGQFENLRKKSGFFPITKVAISEFTELMLDSVGQIDLLASWVPGENRLAHLFRDSEFTKLDFINPFNAQRPWTRALYGKEVLVIHPFEETIKSQFEKRALLHHNPDILPDFSLHTVRSVQSLGGNREEFHSWFEALEYMYEEAMAIDFDVALIAAGAYGFPLAAKLKASGRKVLLVGGILQLFFGIKGQRWNSLGLYNEHWRPPSEAERPSAYRGADRGAYW